MNTVTIKTAVSLASVLLPTPALASTAQASITNLTFALVDLDRQDGIEPSFQVLAGKGGGRATYLWSGAWHPDLPLVRSATPFASLTYLDPDPEADRYRATGADFAISRAEGYGREGRSSSAQPTAYACNDCRLVLSANTRLVITGDYALAAQDQGNSFHSPFFADGRSIATVLLHVANSRAVFGDLDESVSTVRDSFADSVSRSGSFSFNVDNSRDRLRGDYFLSVGAQTAAFGNVVPEPSTYALMLGGLAMVGCVAHRRRKAVQERTTESPRE